jgi:hypothetical protein
VVTTNRPVRWWLLISAAAALLGVTSGCSSAAGASGGSGATAPASPVPSAYATPSGTDCGITRTAINTPVVIKVTKGGVACTTAIAIENDYTGLLRQEIAQASQPHGNGGGAPVSVNGWTCQGYPTPQVLTNGVTSECHTASADVVAVLDVGASPPATG